MSYTEDEVQCCMLLSLCSFSFWSWLRPLSFLGAIFYLYSFKLSLVTSCSLNISSKFLYINNPVFNTHIQLYLVQKPFMCFLFELYGTLQFTYSSLRIHLRSYIFKWPDQVVWKKSTFPLSLTLPPLFPFLSLSICHRNIFWNWSMYAAKSLQSCPTLCDPRDGSPRGSPVPGILQARTLEWVAISFSRAWKGKVEVKSLSRVRLLATPQTAAYQAPLSMGLSRQEYWSGVSLPSPRRCLTSAHVSKYV